MSKKLILVALSLTAVASTIVGGIIFIPAPLPIDCGNVLCAQCPDGTAPAPSPDDCCACESNLK